MSEETETVWPPDFNEGEPHSLFMKRWKESRPDWLKALPFNISRTLSMIGTCDKQVIRRMIESGELFYKFSNRNRSPFRGYGKKSHRLLAEAVGAEFWEDDEDRFRCPCCGNVDRKKRKIARAQSRE